ncbi:MAG: 4-(cytidine 5'-diphospho)-2-C-methyl-D-erythritol kinase [Candidatus Omnitrophica bacterium]|nr:4-(cytidine 5'-diphospho)-2-C-methyl-D-erythritol kinase [Candidatus Omnitrophota bacterium]MCM8808802.1 4-(cytidine 5'-diphospho)-2-C-methyl-D-erythritol kinase [Candidatus Omnitrophota bacterium]MCM8810969.1 4-(cytidine 5'-diphospho)-2-C-methyl-D-erythritol kinase [Candidatus Omnitrophota bacterium]MCM8832864.1 4-(cytidine 5'-diphospho)-2-C-methyl-D-erythritol kinase [Candidatus Omnitrophota bacterium]
MWKIKAPAKINLFLEVGERQNSLHPLVSLVDIVSLYDYIYLKPSRKTNINFISKWKIPEDNTIVRLISILKKRFSFQVDIKIEKKIPPGTGLGGASSDAAYLLLYLNEIFNFGLKIEDMVEIGKKIGSDVPLFFYRKRCLIENCGEKVTVCDDFKFYYLLLIPQFPISTKDVYNKLDKMGEFGNLTEAMEKVKILMEKIKELDIDKIEENMFNRLEKPCFELNNKIKEVRIEIEKKTGKRFFLSGSGGVLYSLFKEKEEVAKIKNLIFLEGWKKVKVESVHVKGGKDGNY